MSPERPPTCFPNAKHQTSFYSTLPATAKRQLHHRFHFHSHVSHNGITHPSYHIYCAIIHACCLPKILCHDFFSLCTQRVMKYVMAKYSYIYQGFAHQDITNHPTSTNLHLKGKSLNQQKIIQNFEMAEQRNHLGEYNTALAEVTRIIREQVRLIENNPSACIEYQRRINQERWQFADAWNVIIKITVLNFQAGYQSSTPNAGTTGRQAQRQITLLPFEAPALWRSCSDTFRNFIFSLPHLSRHSLGEEKECNICYYPFFASRGKLEAEAIRNGTVPRPDKSLEPHEVPFSDLPELPVRLPCGHIFGQICVLKWASGGGSGDPPKCPICRAIWTPVGWSNTPPGQVTIEV